MTESTQNLKRAIDALRDVTKQIALLLKTADGLMEEHNWMVRRGNCISGSTGIESPFEWIPSYFLRTYSNSDSPQVTAYVCVILSAPSDDDEVVVKEPLITACWCYWGNVKKPRSELLAGWAPSHLWAEGRNDDGTIVRTDVKKKWPKDYKSGVTEFYSLALPLDQITSEDDLKAKIIDPFATGVEERHGKRKGK
ncbi:MAG TPA: hypothetical protein VGP72_05305 [Planctomycetota bacterium]|jgi:hypothetical protein